MKHESFAALYCEQHSLPVAGFSRHVFKRTLYPHARLIAWLLQWLSRDYFIPDLDFIHDVGQMTSYRDFSSAGLDYGYHPLNRGFWRRVLKIRVSTELMQRLVREVIDPKLESKQSSGAGTLEPFQKRPANNGPENKPEPRNK